MTPSSQGEGWERRNRNYLCSRRQGGASERGRRSQHPSMWLPATRLVASSHARCAAPRCVRDDVTVRPEFGLPSGLRVGTLEPDDLPHCITVLLECFYKDTLTLAESEFSEEEMKKLRPTLEKINGAFTLYNRLALTQTTRLRLGRRLLSGGTWQMQPPCSLVLVAQEAESGKIVAVAELSTQPLDGKVPGDIRMPNLPWRVSRDTVRSSRSLTRAAAQPERNPHPVPKSSPECHTQECAYVSNLCVSSGWRGCAVPSTALPPPQLP